MKYITITEVVVSSSNVKREDMFTIQRRLYLGGCAFWVEDIKYSREEEEKAKKKLNRYLSDVDYDGRVNDRSVVDYCKKLLVSNAIIKVLDGSSKIGRWFYVTESQADIYKMLDNA